MAQIRMRDGQTLFVRILGHGEPVLLLHGLGMKSAHWLPFVWPLGHRFRFYMPDLRGAGRSWAATFNQPDVFQNHMEDVSDLVAALGLDHFLLVGYSLGASTALQWQNAGGFAKVKRYLNIDQSPCVINRPDWPYGLFGREQEWVFARLARLQRALAQTQAGTLAGLPFTQRRELLRVLSAIYARMLGVHSVKPLASMAAYVPWLMPWLVPMTRVADLKNYLASYTTLGHDYLPGLAGCETPVTVLVGARSPLYAEAGQRAIVETVQNGRVVVLERSGHVPLIDQPFAFTRAFRQFLRGD